MAMNEMCDFSFANQSMANMMKTVQALQKAQVKHDITQQTGQKHITCTCIHQPQAFNDAGHNLTNQMG